MTKLNSISLILVAMYSMLSMSTGCKPVEETQTFELSSSSIDLQSKDPIQVPSTEKTYTLTVKASPTVAWKVITSKGSEFTEATPATEQTGDGSIAIKILKNTTFTEREATVEVTNKLNGIKTTVNFIQNPTGKPAITITPKKVFDNISTQGETISITITTEPVTSLIYVNDNPWISQSTTEPAKWTIDKNDTQTPRTGKVYIKYDTNKELDSLTFTQSANLNQPVRFAVMSDVHFGVSTAISKVSKSLQTICQQTPKVDAIFVVGDVTNYGNEGQYNDLMSTYRTNVPSDIPVYFMMGNHDRYNDASGDLYKRIVNQPFNQYVEIKDFPFITLSVNSTSNSGPSCYSSDTKDFLASKMVAANAKFPGKPIFVFYHVPVDGTVWGSYSPDKWSSETLQSTMRTYKQAIGFSGHTHFPIRDERSIHQEYFTSINDGGNDYGELIVGMSDGIHPNGSDKVTEVLIVDVNTNLDVTVKKIDTYRGEEIKTPWVIEAPHDGSRFLYTSSRNGVTAPVFASGAKPSVDNVDAGGGDVTFPQATDNDLVYSYKVEILNDGGAIEQTYKIFSQFWLGSLTPSTLKWSISGLMPGETYSVRVKGEDSYGMLSDAIISDKFTTLNYTPDPGSSAPVADMLDVMFNKNGATDVASLAIPITTGANKPETFYNSALKLWASRHTGSNTTYFKADYSTSDVFKKAIESSFTYEIYCKTNTTDDMCPFSGQETGGVGIEQCGPNGAYEVWAHIGGGYKNATFKTVNNTDYYHMLFTYDGAKITTYVNGMLIESTEATGKVTFPSADAQWLCVGGDATYAERNTCQYTFKGEIALARFHDNAVSQDEAYRLYEQITERKKVTKFNDLNTALTVTIPAMAAGATKDQLSKEGWALMNNIATTQAAITTFLSKL